MAAALREEVIGVVLAGGAGRRIGGDKALAELEGQPLLWFALRTLSAVVRDVAVVAKEDTRLPQLPPGVARWNEPAEPRHPLAGIRHALREAAGRPVLALAVDLPLVSAASLLGLLEAGAGGRAAALAAGGRAQPLCALYPAAALAVLDAFDPGGRATGALALLDPVEVAPAGGWELMNVNDHADLERAAAILRSVRDGRQGA